MKQGRMKYRLEMQKPSAEADRFSTSATSTFVAAGTCWAERVTITGHYGEDMSEMFHNYDAEYNVRIEQPVTDGWRVQEIGGYLYDVVTTLPNISRGMKTIKCNRVNE